VVIIARGQLKADGAPAALLAGQMAYGACIFEVPTPDWERAASAAGASPGVGGVGIDATLPDGWTRGRATPGHGVKDVREAVAGALRQAGVLARELTAEVASLEQFYLKTIEADDPAAASTTGAGRADA
jgi:hypothetical protein